MIYEEVKKDIEVQKILNYHCRKIKSLMTREDLDSEKESALFRAINTFDSSKTDFNVWLGVCCKYYFLERFRQITQARIFYPVFYEPTTGENLRKIRDTLLLLSDVHRQILTHKYIDGYSHKEIKEMMSLTRDMYCYQLRAAKNIFKEIYLNL